MPLYKEIEPNLTVKADKDIYFLPCRIPNAFLPPRQNNEIKNVSHKDISGKPRYVFSIAYFFLNNKQCSIGQKKIKALCLIKKKNELTEKKDTIMSCRQHGYPWPSLATSPYHSSPPAGLQGYILCPHIVAVCKFVLVVLLLHIHMWGSTGVHRLWARPCFSSGVPRVWFV